MISYKVLEFYKSDNEALRKFFLKHPAPDPENYTSQEEYDKDVTAYNLHESRRTKFIDKIQNRIIDGWTYTAKSFNRYMAIDLALDGVNITKETIPLSLFAQGKIDIKQLATHLKDIPGSEKFITHDEETNTIKDINVPKLHETAYNLCSSYLTRRVASLATRVKNTYPFLKYESRSRNPVDRLRADALTQRIEICVDDFDIRNDVEQAIRAFLSYSHAVLFPSEPWTVEHTLLEDDIPVSGITVKKVKDNEDFVNKLEREGVNFVLPHPSRVFHDPSFAINSLNANKGCEYVGFWDLVKLKDIKNNPAYFNKDEISFSSDSAYVWNANQAYFQYNYGEYTIPLAPKLDTGSSETPTLAEISLANDRVASRPNYTVSDEDTTCFITQYYEKVTPFEMGFGDYPYPVWIRLTVANDDTVIYAEILPSKSPCVVYSYNENQNRVQNASFVEEIMPFQDQATNILTQILDTMKKSMFTMTTADTDAFDKEGKTMKDIEKAMGSENWYAQNLFVPYSSTKVSNSGQNLQAARTPISFIADEAAISRVNGLFSSLTNIINNLERVLNFSSQELGQPAPREISAAETNFISSSATAMFDFIYGAVDSGNQAMKKLLYESFMALGSDEVYTPVIGTYTEKTIKEAGFNVEVSDGDNIEGFKKNTQQTVVGRKRSLIFNFATTSRDGVNRAIDSSTATAYLQFLSQVLQIPTFQKFFTDEAFCNSMNEIARLIGMPGVKLDPDDVRVPEDSMGQPPADQDIIKELSAQIEQIAQQLQIKDAELAQIKQTLGIPTTGAVGEAPLPEPTYTPPIQ